MTPAAVRWRCRRGLLELDLALAGFLEEGYGRLSPSGQALFAELLAESDADLWGWIQGAPAPERYAVILKSFTLPPLNPTDDYS
ncbi:succinate dehydrogenase assembly factor 2 [Acidiferrobacter sp.]|uniref:FAD assembly factor SdhE n=1 Tax=Acidiferrobacter sp. TaxID=1872107 RepID=UPI00261DE630|nr:succinate dehydrogenase assembly factor 2 [Acidiferrobacter sp.]